MSMNKYAQRLMFLFGFGVFGAAVVGTACLEDLCADSKTADFRSMDDIRAMRLIKAEEALQSSAGGLLASPRVGADGRDLASRANRPVRMPDGSIAMPEGWLPAIPEGHPWASVRGPEDEAFHSFFEERVLRPMLYDESNAEHRAWAQAYLAKARSNSPEFPAYTYQETTECPKKKFDAAGTCEGGGTRDEQGNCPKIDAF